jgi:hypothetical protein
MVILLDLMYTLIGNMAERAAFEKSGGKYAGWIQQERVRPWLVDLLRNSGLQVLLMTVRQEKWRQATLARIAEQTGGWQPDQAYFSQRPMPPPSAKRGMLLHDVFPQWGRDASLYLALESNPATRQMYASFGIRAIPVPDAPWTALPLEPEEISFA